MSVTSHSFSLSKINLGEEQAPWLHSDCSNQASNGENRNNIETTACIHLSPANGLPVASYYSFIGLLNQRYAVSGMDCRGAWAKRSIPPRQFGVANFADDLIKGIESGHENPVIGMGHSHGGLITVAAAVKRPDLFSKLVIIDGASLPTRRASILMSLFPKELIIKFSALVRGSHFRQSVWESKDAFYQRYREHGTFKRFTDRDLRAYAEYGLFERADGQFELVFDPAWESHIFCRVRFLWTFLRRTTLPTLLIRAQHSNLYTRAQFRRNNLMLNPNIVPIEIADTHHLLTHEKPKLVSEAILEWL